VKKLLKKHNNILPSNRELRRIDSNLVAYMARHPEYFKGIKQKCRYKHIRIIGE